MSLLARRLRRLAAKRSPAAVAAAAARELHLLLEEAQLERALRSDRRLIVGPFLGEVGYELLFWRPRVLRLLRTRRVDPDRVVVVSRGGAGAWYAPYADDAVDVLELISPDELRIHVDERAERTGQRKQIRREGLDDSLIAALRERVGPADVFHPSVMYNRLRFFWDGLRPAAEAREAGDYDDLPRVPLAPAVEERLPDRFTAVKLYFNEALADAPAVREALRARLPADLPLVLLEAGVAVDDHADWSPEGVDVVHVGDALDPRSNLAAQAEIVARAQRLVATYGGFSYVGPFSGVATVALASRREANPHHEHVMRAVRPNAEYVREWL